MSRPWLVLGMPGTGKTTFARRLVDDLLRDGRALAVIHDPHGEDGAGEGYAGDVFPTVAHFEAAWRAGRLRDRRIIFRQVDLGELAALAFRLSGSVAEGVPPVRRVILVVDELDKACFPGGRYVDDPPRRPGAPPRRGNFYAILNYGRHRGIDLVGTARRTANIGTDIGANAEAIYLFRLSGHTDLAWVREVTDERTAVLVGQLPPFQCYVYNKFRPLALMRLDGGSRNCPPVKAESPNPA